MNSAHMELLRGAVARGWCAEGNRHKEMDSDLAEAIVVEVAEYISELLAQNERYATRASDMETITGGVTKKTLNVVSAGADVGKSFASVEQSTECSKKWLDSVGLGWQPIVQEAVMKLQNLGYKIDQVKEKFGGLRIYAHPISIQDDTMPNLVAADEIVLLAERVASVTCEQCGAPGSLRTDKKWMRILCDEHNK